MLIVGFKLNVVFIYQRDNAIGRSKILAVKRTGSSNTASGIELSMRYGFSASNRDSSFGGINRVEFEDICGRQ